MDKVSSKKLQSLEKDIEHLNSLIELSFISHQYSEISDFLVVLQEYISKVLPSFSVVFLYSAGNNVNISEQNVISATDTTYSDFAGGGHGLVPPVQTQAGKYLKDDGTWGTPSGGGGTSALNDLTDVSLTNPTDGQTLGYNAQSGKWENVAPSGGTEVEANPTGTPTDALKTISIDNVIYDLASGEIVTDIKEYNPQAYVFMYESGQDVDFSSVDGDIWIQTVLVESGVYKGEAVRVIPIPATVKKIRYRLVIKENNIRGVAIIR